MAISLYRKYRPQTFDDVVGQEHIERTLRNAVADGNTSHAYLFCGPRGTGKTTTARLLAKALICENGPTPDPCGTCRQCKEVAAGSHPDVYELDAASRTGVENVREEIIGRVAFAPTSGRYKVYIIDEVHMLSIAAFNALLKTLEEPPEHVVFILCTTDPHKVPDTIHSRCQRFDFHRIAATDIIGNLKMICDKEGFTAENEALEMVARQSSGGMRDAISMLEQLAVFTGGKITAASAEGLLGEVGSSQLHEIAALIAARDVAGCYKWVAGFVESGTDLAQFSRDMTAYLRDLYVITLTGSVENIQTSDQEDAPRMKEAAKTFGGPARLARALLILSDLNAELRTATDARLSLEIALTRLAYPMADLTLESLAERVEALEKGVPAASVQTAATKPASASAATAASRGAAATNQTATAKPVPVQTQDASVAHKQQRVSAVSEPVTRHAKLEPPSQAAAPAAPVITGALDAATVSRLWAAAARSITGQKKSLSGAITSARAYVGGGESIVIELPHGSSFSKRMLEEASNYALIKECITAAFGKPIEFSIAVSTNEPGPPPTLPIEDSPSIDLFEASAPVAAISGNGSSEDDEDEPEFIYDDGDVFSGDEGYGLGYDDPSIPVNFGEGLPSNVPAEAEAPANKDFAPVEQMDEGLANLIFGAFEKQDENPEG